MIIRYKQEYYQDLSRAYKNSFARELIDRELYWLRFSWKDEPTSFLFIEEGQIMGHIGYRIREARHGSVAFRFSTFVSKELRGSSCYPELRTHSMEDIRDRIGVQTVFTWPNRVNLISSLKDPDFYLSESIPTWQIKGRLIGNGKEVEIEEPQIGEILLERMNNGSLTVETSTSLMKEIRVRNDRDFKAVVEKGEVRALVSVKMIEGIEYSAYYYVEGDYLMDCRIEEEADVVNQLWIDRQDRDLMRAALKVGFEQNGPVFNLGIYSFCEQPEKTVGSARMYHHDVF